MKICVLTHTFPRNNQDVAAAFMKEFCDGLVQNKNEVVLLTPYDSNFSRKNDIFKIYTYKYIWPKQFHTLGYSKTMSKDIKLKKQAFILLPFLIIFGFFALLKTVKNEKIEIISVHWILPNGLIAFLVSKITGVPYVITLPGTDAYLAYKYKIFGIVAKIIAQNSAGIISNSSWHLKRIMDLGITDKPTEVISYPVDVTSFRPLKQNLDLYRKELHLNNNNLVILAVGRLVYKKGFDILIKSFPQVLNKFPNARLIIGGDGDLKNNLTQLVNNLNLQDKVIFTGTLNRDKIIYYYNLADLMVSPSVVDKDGNVDGGPVVSTESMACGKPQILTNILGMADLITNGIHGFVIKQKNHIALTEAINKLLESKLLRQKMGIACRNLVINELSTKFIGKKYTQFFKKIIIKNV